MKKWLQFKWWRLKLYHQAIRDRVTGRCPRKGDLVRWCGDGDDAIKTVEHVTIVGDNIEYTDGSSDSYRHCGWEIVQKARK